MSLYRSYAAAGHKCSGGPTSGAVALMAWFLGAYKTRGARNDGIYNCRSVRGGTEPSLHSEGRAADLGCRAGDTWAQPLANLLVAHSAELGIQCVIYNRRIWSGQHPDAGWRSYSGVDHHTTHLHVELSRKAAAGLTVERIVSVLTPEDEVKEADIVKIVDRVADEVMRRLTVDRIVENVPLEKGDPQGKNFTVAEVLAASDRKTDLQGRVLKEIYAAVTVKP
jgi:hypothetical protein